MFSIFLVEVAMSGKNILLEKSLLFIDAMSVHSRLKCSQFYRKHILHSHGRHGGVCNYCHLGFHSSKNLSIDLLATHGLPVMSADSADLAITKAAADAPLGDLHAADGDEIKGMSLQKNESAFWCS